MELNVIDISAKVFGKYQFCTKARDGLLYSDDDFKLGDGCGGLKPTALPAPPYYQDEKQRARAVKIIANGIGFWTKLRRCIS